MKKSLLYSLLLVSILVLAYFTVFQQQTNTIEKADTAFALKDTAIINKIEITGKDGRKILLERPTNNIWRVNTHYKARPDAIHNLLKTIRNLKVLHPVGKNALPNVQKMFEGKPLRTVKIYWENNAEMPIKTYYLGGLKANKKGTYMQIEGEELPYVMYVPGVDGYLVNHYFTDIVQWRDRGIFNYEAQNIASIQVDYPHQPERGFSLEVAKEPIVKNWEGKDNPDTDKVVNEKAAFDFVSSFNGVYSEAYQNDYIKQDSVRQSLPYCKIKVTTTKGFENEVVIHYMPVYERSKKQFEEDGTAVDYDHDRYFAFIHKGNDFVLIQQYAFGQLFKTYEDFFRPKE